MDQEDLSQSFLKKSFLVTGATGFIGANVTRSLIFNNANVHILVRKISDKWRISEILKDVVQHQVDLSDIEKLKNIIPKIKPDFIIHCATYGGHPYQKDIHKIYETNLQGTINLLDALSEVDYRCFINTGSSSEYGVKSKPMVEEDFLEPVNAYGASKASATLFCQFLAKTQKRPIVTLRLFSPYGPYCEQPNRLIAGVIETCLAGKKLELTTGEAVRDFIFIEDVIEMHMKVANSPQSGQVFNIGSGSQYTVKEVVEKIIEHLGAKIKPIWGAIPTRPFEPKIWKADISKAKKQFNWTPRYSLDDGLSKTIAWHKQYKRFTRDKNK